MRATLLDTYFQVFETINDQSLTENWQGTSPLYSRPQIKINCEFVSLFFTRTYSKKERQGKWPLESLVFLSHPNSFS